MLTPAQREQEVKAARALRASATGSAPAPGMPPPLPLASSPAWGPGTSEPSWLRDRKLLPDLPPTYPVADSNGKSFGLGAKETVALLTMLDPLQVRVVREELWK